MTSAHTQQHPTNHAQTQDQELRHPHLHRHQHPNRTPQHPHQRKHPEPTETPSATPATPAPSTTPETPSPTTNQHKKPPNDHVTPKALQPRHPPTRTQNHHQQHPHHQKRQHHQQSSQHNTLTITITGGTAVLTIAYDTYAPTNTGYNAYITQANSIKHTIASITQPSASPPATSATRRNQSHHNR